MCKNCECVLSLRDVGVYQAGLGAFEAEPHKRLKVWVFLSSVAFKTSVTSNGEGALLFSSKSSFCAHIEVCTLFIYRKKAVQVCKVLNKSKRLHLTQIYHLAIALTAFKVFLLVVCCQCRWTKRRQDRGTTAMATLKLKG